MTDSRLERLQKIAQMVHEHELARTGKLTAAREATRMTRDRLSRPVSMESESALFIARQTHLQWASGQRMLLNQRLARETAQLLEQRRKTARSLSRVEALKRLQEKLAKG